MVKQILLLFTLLWLLPILTQAQVFNRLYDNNNEWGGSRSIIQNPDSTITCLEITNNLVTQDTTRFEALRFLKLDNKGNILISKLYRINNRNFTPGASHGLCSNQDGGYMFTGDISGDSPAGIVVVRFTKTGDTLWLKAYNKTAFSSWGNAIILDKDDNFLVGGSSSEWAGGTNRKCFLMKINGDGKMLWKRSYPELSNYLDGISHIEVLPNGDLLLSGQYNRRERWCDSVEQLHSMLISRKLLMRTDSLGNLIKLFSFEKDKSSLGGISFTKYLLEIDKILVTGYEYYKNDKYLCNITYNQYVALLDMEGNKIWQMKSDNELNAWISAGFRTQSGQYMVAGSKFFNGNASGNIIRLDSNGNKLWEKIYRQSGSSYIFAVDKTLEEGIVMTGFSRPNDNPNQKDQDTWVVKTDSNGCDTITCLAVNSIEELVVKGSSGFKVVPNPAKDNFLLQLEGDMQWNVRTQVTVMDYTGRVLQAPFTVNGGKIEVSVAHLPKGVYICSWQSDKNKGVFKVIKE